MKWLFSKKNLSIFLFSTVFLLIGVTISKNKHTPSTENLSIEYKNSYSENASPSNCSAARSNKITETSGEAKYDQYKKYENVRDEELAQKSDSIQRQTQVAETLRSLSNNPTRTQIDELFATLEGHESAEKIRLRWTM